MPPCKWPGEAEFRRVVDAGIGLLSAEALFAPQRRLAEVDLEARRLAHEMGSGEEIGVVLAGIVFPGHSVLALQKLPTFASSRTFL